MTHSLRDIGFCLGSRVFVGRHRPFPDAGTPEEGATTCGTCQGSRYHRLAGIGRGFAKEITFGVRHSLCHATRAPELAILEALNAALETAVVAVVAANPALVGPDPFEPDWDDHPPPSARLYAADAIIYVTHALRAALDRYRCATRLTRNERPPT